MRTQTSKTDQIRKMLIDALPSIWRFSLSITGDVELSNDLTQSTCARALEKSDQFKYAGSFTGWCLQICRSIWLNELRSRAKEHAFATLSDKEIPTISSIAETQIFAKEMISKVMCLPREQRLVVCLVFVEEFTYSEAATILDVPIGTIMSRLHAARKTLKAFAAEKKPFKGVEPR